MFTSRKCLSIYYDLKKNLNIDLCLCFIESFVYQGGHWMISLVKKSLKLKGKEGEQDKEKEGDR